MNDNWCICFFLIVVSPCIISAGLLLLPAAGLCQCSWLLWAADLVEPWRGRISPLLCSIFVQGQSLRGGYEGLLSDWQPYLSTQGQFIHSFIHSFQIFL